MDNVEVPEDFSEETNGSVVIIGPPPGVSREHCVDAKIHMTDEFSDDGMGLMFTAFFRPSEKELKHLNEGGLLKVQLRGGGLVPHSLGIW